MAAKRGGFKSFGKSETLEEKSVDELLDKVDKDLSESPEKAVSTFKEPKKDYNQHPKFKKFKGELK
jgi:hypothetical protein